MLQMQTQILYDIAGNVPDNEKAPGQSQWKFQYLPMAICGDDKDKIKVGIIMF